MRDAFSFSALSLRTKLVLSYLLAIIGTVLILSLVVSSAAERYFIQLQTTGMSQSSRSLAGTISFLYGHYNGNWGDVVGSLTTTNDVLLAIDDSTGNQPACLQPSSIADNCNNPTIQQALASALKTQTVQYGTISISTGNSTVSSVYVTRPLTLGRDGPLIGAMFLTEPLLSSDFIQQVDRTIFLVGFLVALIAGLGGFLLVRHLTRPLKALTVAAEQMKDGKYTQRVVVPRQLDELGELALTFNEMADTIEADMNELRRQDQVRRDLIANVAHDLATPLTAIQGFSEALLDDVITDPAMRQETGQRIRREIQRLQRLINDVKQVSSLEAGHTQLDLAPLDMRSLVDETLFVIEPECENKGISVHNEIASAMPPVLADSDRITQVLLNLLDNARRHTPEGGKLTVGASYDDRQVQVWVKDTGCGIDTADLPHIFERFYRADQSRTSATGGTGLGLAIVKAIISAHNGTIRAESVPGQGTTITFSLPIAVETSAATTTAGVDAKKSKPSALSGTK